jgi:uncharacterized MnhB-related membrane protein
VGAEKTLFDSTSIQEATMKSKPDLEKLNLLYEENATQFRFFLTWRQILLAGYFAIIAALALGFEWAVIHAPDLTFACPLAGACVSVLFWALDFRNRELYHHASDVGAVIEEAMGHQQIGYYGTYQKTKKSKWRHSRLLKTFYLASGAAMLIISIITLFVRIPTTGSGG